MFSGSTPQIIALHGYLGRPDKLQRASELDAIAVGEGWPLPLYPSQKFGRWPWYGGDRFAPLAATCERVLGLFEDRPQALRVLAGFSRGANMALRIALRYPSQVDLVVIHSGELRVCGWEPTADPRRMPPALIIGGLADRLVPWRDNGAKIADHFERVETLVIPDSGHAWNSAAANPFILARIRQQLLAFHPAAARS